MFYIVNYFQVISGANLCTWNSSNGCSITPPPKSITFVLLVAFITVIFVIVLDYFVGYLLMEYASKRPRLESWGLSTDSWLGSVQHRRARDKSLITNAALSHASKQEKRDVIVENVEKIHSERDVLDIVATESDFLSNEIYNDFLSPREECIRLMTRVQEFLDIDGSVSKRRIRNHSPNTSFLSHEHLAAMKAIGSQLMVNFDGTMKPITFRQKLFYRDRQDLIEKKLAVARKKSLKICNTICKMEVLDDNLKDIALMRKFILEQVSIFYRFSLKKNFLDIDGVPPEIIRPSLWLMSWTLAICVLLFFVYWIFAWGIKNGGATLDQWGTNYGIAIVQDVLVLEVGKVFIIYAFALMSAKPQLQVIKRVINDRALSLVQDSPVFSDEVSVVQHFSPACRAARTNDLCRLSASAILRSMTDADMEKCKEHKYFTLGRVIFYVIMVAAVVAVLSETLIDQLLTLIISSLLLAFLLIHSKLLAISPLLLICIYGVLGGVGLYYLGIFVPSVKRARQARAKKAQTARECVRSTSRNIFNRRNSSLSDNLMRVFRRLSIRLVEYAGHLHSIVSYEKVKRQRDKCMTVNLMWCRMNKTIDIQFRTISSSASRLGRQSSRTIPNEGESDSVNFSSSIPLTILKMRQSGSTFCRDVAPPKVANLFTAQASSTLKIEIPKGLRSSFPAVQSPRNIGKLGISYMANKEITTDPKVALRRMLERHVLGADRYSNGEECSFLDIDNASDIFISTSELYEMLAWTWVNFYPCGQKLTDELKSEIDERFEVWKKSLARNEIRTSRSSEEMSRTWGSLFPAFADWFLKTCTAINLHVTPTRQLDLDDF